MTRTIDAKLLASMDFSALPQTQEFPAMQFYPKEWTTGQATRAMGPNQRGGFIDLLAEAWDQKPPCSLPDDDDALAGFSRMGTQVWAKYGGLVRRQFVACADGRLRNPKQIAVWLGMMDLRTKRRNSRNKGRRVVTTNDELCDDNLGGLLTPAIPTPTPDAEAAGSMREIPVDFAPSDDDREWARRECGLTDNEIDARTKRFVRHHRGKGNKFKRPSQAWRNWIDERFVNDRKADGDRTPKPERERNKFHQRTGEEVMADLRKRGMLAVPGEIDGGADEPV